MAKRMLREISNDDQTPKKRDKKRETELYEIEQPKVIPIDTKTSAMLAEY